MSGHLLVLSIITPFYVDVSSLGSPAIFHACITTGTPKNDRIFILLECYIPIYLSFVYHCFYILVLYAAVNGPE